MWLLFPIAFVNACFNENNDSANDDATPTRRGGGFKTTTVTVEQCSPFVDDNYVETKQDDQIKIVQPANGVEIVPIYFKCQPTFTLTSAQKGHVAM